jgi:hypothetical protein
MKTELKKTKYFAQIKYTENWEEITEYRYNACFLGAWGIYCRARAEVISLTNL